MWVDGLCFFARDAEEPCVECCDGVVEEVGALLVDLDRTTDQSGSVVWISAVVGVYVLTYRALICVIGVIPRVDIESMSFVWDLSLDVFLVDEVLPQLARAVPVHVSK